MSHPYHHALSSVKKWGGKVEDYLPIHDWFDESKKMMADFRHRALRHHAEGIFMCETIFGHTLTLSNGNVIPTRWVGEQHVREDLGRIPSMQDWFSQIVPKQWMSPQTNLDVERELKDRIKEASSAAAESVVAAVCREPLAPSFLAGCLAAVPEREATGLPDPRQVG